MTYYKLPEKQRNLNIHEERLRQRNVYDALRKLGLDRPLPLDGFYADGEINKWQWDAGHTFREGRIAQLEARARGTENRKGLKPRKPTYSAKAAMVERAFRIERRELTPEYHQIALALIGEIFMTVEPEMAKRVTVRLAVAYELVPEGLRCLYRS